MKFIFNIFLFISVSTIGVILTSCEPETIVETEIVTVNDTLVISMTDTLIVSTIDTFLIQDNTEVTNIILVRHAEVVGGGSDPELSQIGIERAERLANLLSEMELDRVYSTDFRRTLQTAMPVVNDQGLAISNYGGFDHEDVINDILVNENKGKILIVGHSNTTANFLNALTGTSDYPDLLENSYDNLFIVNTKSMGDAEVIHIKY